ncbi:hypothetical protein ASE01_00855 [Nocardioides sp. Root190]|uniref:hypothetical protein n=1 Tax=Nocardioides sp. Root190 TaxID=1736488 RepID=UPI0006FCB234|nr:hypothetical protein [Nocardioides sp. Root190]KRB80088.1 hypothetical protein ASE01_00855 [Nocardioides sp. Root190]
MAHTIDSIRTLINEPAIRGELLVDLPLWDRVCTAMDVLSDSGYLPDRVDATNVLAEVAGESRLPSNATDADVSSALDRVGAGLERRSRRAHKGHSARPLEEAFTTFKGLDYAIEKLSGLTRGGPSDRVMAGAAIDQLEPLIVATRDGLDDRGLHGADMTQDLELILRRAKEYVDGAPGAPAAEDIELLTRHSFKKLLHKLQQAAREADAEDGTY